MSLLAQMVTRLPAVLSVLSSWESCALSIIEKERPTTVSFFCNSSADCPNSSFYKVMSSPSRTFFGLGIEDLPNFTATDLVFLALREDALIWDNKTVQKYRMGGRNSFKVLLVMNITEDFVSMESLFQAMWESGVVRSGVILKNESTSQIYSYIPFRKGGVCGDTSPVYLGECSTAYETVFDVKNKIFNLNKCPVRLSFADDNPWIRKNPLSGRIGYMVQELAKRLNFGVKTTTPLQDRNGGVCGPAEYTGSKGDVVHGKAEVALGLFNRLECSTLNYIGLPHMKRLSWCTPLISERLYIFLFLLELLHPVVWAALLTTMVLVVFIVITLRYMQNEQVSMSNAIYLTCSIFAVVPIQFRTFPERIFVAAWLFACLVLRTVYEGELKSKSAVPLGSHIISGLEELAEMDMKLCTTIANLQALEGMDDPIMQTLTNKTKLCEGGLFENMESAAIHQDGAVLSSDLRCAVTSAEISNKKRPLLYPLSGGRTNLFQFVPMVTLPGLPFNEMFAVILQRCYESGLVNKWIDTHSDVRNVAQVRRLAVRNILPPLFILFLGCSVGFFVLIIENTYFRWSVITLKTSYYKKLLKERYGIIEKK